jgi:hypothetical protein
MILFAYAGNMDVDEFSKTVPSAKKIGVARLPGYNFIFNKTAGDDSSKANITPSTEPDAEVWGVLIQLNIKEILKFFNPNLPTCDLKLETVICLDKNDQIYQAEAFFAQTIAVNTHLLPYDWYHQRIIQFAKAAKLPAEYIYKIALMSFKADHNEKRKKRQLSKLKD